MVQLNRHGVSIHYEEFGSGPAMLLLAPGGFNSTIDFWGRAAINPLEAYAEDFHLIAMDQRNAGESRGPFAVDDPWGSYIDDQLAVVDHLGIERFLVMGCCIGCSYALKLIERAPERVRAAVLEQPIGITEENLVTWATSRREWLSGLVATRRDLDDGSGEAFGEAMWRDAEFVVSVTREGVASCPVPLAVLPGIDAMHPTEIGREVAQLAPDVTLIEPWKDSPEHVVAATEAVRRFLHEHAGRPAY